MPSGLQCCTVFHINFDDNYRMVVYRKYWQLVVPTIWELVCKGVTVVEASLVQPSINCLTWIISSTEPSMGCKTQLSGGEFFSDYSV